MRFGGAAAVTVTIALTAAACGQSGNSATATGAGFNAATTSIVNQSSSSGGTLKLVNAQDWDSPDPGNTYDTFSWDFLHLYARPLLSYANKPGTAGLTLEPDLATGLGQVSDNGLTWTYHIRSGVKYSNGQTVTSADVKYAIERSNWGQNVLSGGPSYFRKLIDPKAASGGQSWPGPYKDPHGSLPNSMIATPNPTTIVFHLLKPFADFNYVAALPDTAPVPQSADKGSQYQNHILSTGPYQIDSFTPGKGMTLSKNPYWNAATDPEHLHPQPVDKIEVQTHVDANTVDEDLLSNQAQVDLGGVGVQSATQSKILVNQQLKSNADNPDTGALDYAAISVQVQPFTNLDCRKAVEFAANKVELLNQYGGEAAGAIADTVMPPTVAGYTNYPNPYATPGDTGDDAKAKQLLASCKEQLGPEFTPSFTIAARFDHPNEVAAATALQYQLEQVGFKPTIKEYASSGYITDFAGDPSYSKEHSLGIMFLTWQSDWPDGYGFMEPIVDGADLQASGNTDMGNLDDPKINSMINAATQINNTQQRNAAWGKIDEAVMDDAAILPIVYQKALLYRPPSATNVMFSYAYGMYDFPIIGVKH
jgi:peptide/nickel transport system substrate-binding protein